MIVSPVVYRILVLVQRLRAAVEGYGGKDGSVDKA